MWSFVGFIPGVKRAQRLNVPFDLLGGAGVINGQLQRWLLCKT